MLLSPALFICLSCLTVHYIPFSPSILSICSVAGKYFICPMVEILLWIGWWLLMVNTQPNNIKCISGIYIYVLKSLIYGSFFKNLCWQSINEGTCFQHVIWKDDALVPLFSKAWITRNANFCIQHPIFKDRNRKFSFGEKKMGPNLNPLCTLYFQRKFGGTMATQAPFSSWSCRKVMDYWVWKIKPHIQTSIHTSYQTLQE